MPHTFGECLAGAGVSAADPARPTREPAFHNRASSVWRASARAIRFRYGSADTLGAGAARQARCLSRRGAQPAGAAQKLVCRQCAESRAKGNQFAVAGFPPTAPFASYASLARSGEGVPQGEGHADCTDSSSCCHPRTIGDQTTTALRRPSTASLGGRTQGDRRNTLGWRARLIREDGAAHRLAPGADRPERRTVFGSSRGRSRRHAPRRRAAQEESDMKAARRPRELAVVP